MIELTPAELGERLVREAVQIRPDGWASRADIYEAYIEWAEEEDVRADYSQTHVFRALRSAGADEAKRQGVRGFRVRIRSAEWTPEGQLARFLDDRDLVTVTESGWMPWGQLYRLYDNWARSAGEDPMTLRKFIKLLDGEGFKRQRQLDTSAGTYQRRTPEGFVNVSRLSWGFEGIVPARPDKASD